MRPAIEAAAQVARAGREDKPPVDPPEALLPFLEFRRLPPAASTVIWDALDDQEFRGRVVAHCAAGSPLSAVLSLAIERPPGWRVVLEELAVARAGSAAAKSDRQSSKALERRLNAAETARSRAEAAESEQVDVVAEARAEVAELRRALTEAVAARDEAAAAEAIAVAERVEFDDRRRSVERDLHVARAEVRAATQASEDRSRSAQPPIDVGVVGANLAALGESVEEIRARIQAFAETLAPLLAPAPVVVASPRAVDVVRREPMPVPSGLVQEDVETARRWLRAQRVLCLVDGYNVSKTTWGDSLGIEGQRRRLEQAAGAFAARTGLDLVLVWDGQPGVVATASPRAAIRNIFTDGTEADDEILAMVESLPATRPVVVVSNDRRVSDGSRRLGANAVSVAAFVALL